MSNKYKVGDKVITPEGEGIIEKIAKHKTCHPYYVGFEDRESCWFREHHLEVEYDYINPNHYKSFDKEVYEMMIDIWGRDAFIKHCEICAFKYKMRLGSKPDQPIERDLEKAEWYLNKAKELKREIPTIDRKDLTHTE